MLNDLSAKRLTFLAFYLLVTGSYVEFFVITATLATLGLKISYCSAEQRHSTRTPLVISSARLKVCSKLRVRQLGVDKMITENKIKSKNTMLAKLIELIATYKKLKNQAVSVVTTLVYQTPKALALFGGFSLRL